MSVVANYWISARTKLDPCTVPLWGCQSGGVWKISADKISYGLPSLTKNNPYNPLPSSAHLRNFFSMQVLCKSWSSPSKVKTLENWEKPFTPCQHNIIPKNILNWRQVLLRKIVRESTLLDTVYLFELSSLNCHKSRAVRIIFTIKKKSLSTLASVGCTFHVFYFLRKILSWSLMTLTFLIRKQK